MGQSDLRHTLQSLGFIGSWQIDFTVNKVQADGSVGSVFGIKPEVIRQGVDLSRCDRAYLPEDLEMVKRARRDAIGVGGRHHLHYRLLDFNTGLYRPIQAMINATISRDGSLQGAQGILFHDLPQVQNEELRTTTHDATMSALVQAANAVELLGLSYLRPFLQVAFKHVAQDAIERSWDQQH